MIVVYDFFFMAMAVIIDRFGLWLEFYFMVLTCLYFFLSFLSVVYRSLWVLGRLLGVFLYAEGVRFSVVREPHRLLSSLALVLVGVFGLLLVRSVVL